eukprot:Rhum_TRINITY_DN15251_c0_g1::Rhum_TRINITY_DN15251_c0_g1_i3::g.144791::m.144791/K00505/TYR; tyrosinase
MRRVTLLLLGAVASVTACGWFCDTDCYTYYRTPAVATDTATCVAGQTITMLAGQTSCQHLPDGDTLPVSTTEAVCTVVGRNAQRYYKYDVECHTSGPCAIAVDVEEENVDCRCECPQKVRRPWASLTCAERDTYIRAVKKLKTQQPQLFDDIVNTHPLAGSYAHGTSAFLPWHRWYLLSYEEALRSLGGEFRCLTLPYWDWLRDSSDDHTVQAKSPALSAAHFGTHGGIDASGCVNDGVAAVQDGWRVTGGVDCLQRGWTATARFTSEPELASMIMSFPHYGDFYARLEGIPHNFVHGWIGGHMSSYMSPEDPLFFLHHCNVDRLWAAWMDYWGYDEIDTQMYMPTHYYPDARGGPTAHVELDAVMPFPKDGTGATTPFLSRPVTVRQMMHLRALVVEGQDYSYTYGHDNLAFVLGTPAAGAGWSWMVPVATDRVWCPASDEPAGRAGAVEQGGVVQQFDYSTVLGKTATTVPTRAEAMTTLALSICRREQATFQLTTDDVQRIEMLNPAPHLQFYRPCGIQPVPDTCVDLKLSTQGSSLTAWTDTWGGFDCAYYAEHAAVMCPQHGHLWRNVYVANEACCVCGGGSTAIRGSTPPPTPSPPTTGCNVEIPVWGNCHETPSCCATGAHCVVESQWYAQCRPL